MTATPFKKVAANLKDKAMFKGAFTGSIAGLLLGLGVLAIPGVGPMMLIGAEAAAIATALSGGAMGAAAGALIRSGIPEEQAKTYSDRLLQGQYLMFINGTEADILAAKVIVNLYNIQEWRVYDAPPKNP